MADKASQGSSLIGSVGTIVGMLVIFIIVLAAAYYTTRVFGQKSGFAGPNHNIKVIETARLAPDRYLQIVRAAGRYYLIGITKNNISMLAELPQDAVEEYQPAGDGQGQFLDIFKEQFKEKFSKKK